MHYIEILAHAKLKDRGDNISAVFLNGVLVGFYEKVKFVESFLMFDLSALDWDD